MRTSVASVRARSRTTAPDRTFLGAIPFQRPRLGGNGGFVEPIAGWSMENPSKKMDDDWWGEDS